MCINIVGYQIYKSYRYRQLNDCICQRYHGVAYFQLISHKLIDVFTVSLSKIFMYKNPVTYSQTPIHTIYKQEYKPCDITSFN